MGLPWVRLDTNLAQHDKILELLADDNAPITARYQAAFSYICSIGYAGGNETDGLIRFAALPVIHGTKKTAHLLVTHFLWAPDPLGWHVVNFEKRQQSSATAKHIRNAQRAGALKANCTRWHGPDCGCWEAAS